MSEVAAIRLAAAFTGTPESWASLGVTTSTEPTGALMPVPMAVPPMLISHIR